MDLEVDIDDLIDEILIEISFSGVRGCSISTLMKTIESFYGNAQSGTGNAPRPHHGESNQLDGISESTAAPNGESHAKQNTSGDDFSMVSKVWGWLAVRSDVSVGVNRRFNHLSLDEILALPEEEENPPSEDTKSTDNQIATPVKYNHRLPSKRSRELEGVAPKFRPRLHVSEEHQWKTLTGHGPDLKRIPLFEWKALVDIASARENGILQGDLVRLSGQDKRSVPVRTENLAKKGYIIKQPIVLRGCRSSKLWLARFAESAKLGRDGLNFNKLDLSKEALTKDLAPVPFSAYWNGERLDYIAIAQAFNAVLKAWGIMRYCDMRTKLDANRVPQMRALAKTSRWFTNIGAATFVAARFATGQKLFKDCVKFIREPTSEEWRVFRTTPSAHIKAPSARLGRRGQASRAKHKKGVQAGPHSQAKSKNIPAKRHESETANQEELTPSLWTPYKPMANTAFEIIKRAGPEGSSNAKFGRNTLGHSYRKYIAALTGALSLPNSQPPHLQHLNITSQLNRLGKTMTYQFFANNEIGSSSNVPGKEVENRDQETSAAGQVSDGDISQQNLSDSANSYTFSEPQLSKFVSMPTHSLSQLHHILQNSGPKKNGRKRKMCDEPTKGASRDSWAPPSKIPRIKGSLLTKVKADEIPMNNQEANSLEGTVPAETPQQPIHSSEPSVPPPSPTPTPPTPPRPPGVYREHDNMLDPPGRKGRKKKSLVLTIKLDALKDPGLHERMQNRRQACLEEGSSSQINPTPTADAVQDDSTMSIEAGSIQPKRKTTKRGGTSIYRCDNCGNSWKNSNGLEYHLNKSRSACNPSYVAPPPPPPPPPKPPRLTAKPKSILQSMTSNISEDQSENQGEGEGQGQGRTRTRASRDSNRSMPQNKPLFGDRRLLPSKRARPSETYVQSKVAEGSSRVNSIGGSITLQDLEAYDVVDRRRRRNSQAVPSGIYNASSQLHQTGPGSKKLSSANQRGTVPGPEMEKEQYGAASSEIRETRADNHDISLARNQNSRTEKMPVNYSTSEMVTNPRATNHPIGSGLAGNNLGLTTVNNQPGKETLQKETLQSKKQPAPKKSRKPNPTVGTLRRDRTALIIQHLLENNDGVFPGQRSLYLATVALWAKRYHDIEPPDWKTSQNVVNRMEKDKALMQVHFCFLNEKGKLEECCVLAKVNPGETTTTNLAADPKVVIIKEKMREMFPEPYIPEAFSLSKEENELFDALSSRYRHDPRPEDAHKEPQKSIVTEDIEVLQYPAHVLGDVSAYATGLKRHREDESTDEVPAKKTRVHARKVGLPPSRLKSRKQGDHRDHREYWDAGKVAKHIWNRKQNLSEKWSQEPACLQDFSTGTWSNLPPETTSLAPDIDTILSSIRTSRENALASMRRPTQDYQGGGIDRFVKPSISTSFVPDDFISEDEDDDTSMVDLQDVSLADEDEDPPSEEAGIKFAKSQTIQSTREGCWPSLPAIFFEENRSFMLVGTMPDAKWFQRENLPQSAGDIIRSFRGKLQFNSWADPSYGKFLREVSLVEKWEQSADGSQILLHGSIAPEHIFISLSPDASKANMKPIALEWPSQSQYTLENIPDEIKNASPDDENAGLPSPITRGRGRPRRKSNTESPPKGKSKQAAKRAPRKSQPAILPRVEVQYKTRSLKPIPILHRGRVNRPDETDDRPSLIGETNLIAAFVVFKTLLGGVEKKVDIGLLLKAFPQFSHSALRKFWPRVSKERKTYIDALTKKFQSAFLEAYEAGDIKPIDYDDLESYDWRSLVLWAAKLETHENVNLPESRHALEETHSLVDQVNEIRDWRETWVHNLTSVHSRVDATVSKPMSIPLSRDVTAEEELISRTRSWVRSLCVTPIKGAKMPEEIRAKFLRLSGRNEADTNKLLKKVVGRLSSERIAARSKGKILGQSLRLHGVFVKQLEKPSHVEKFTQATNFKALLDQTFRKGEEYHLPYVANDGTIMAVINLQAHGRIHVEAISLPNIPFGFEPGNYDGRTFPKSYYHFNIKLLPTETYVYDNDIPLLKQAGRMNVPLIGPREEIPIWVDFFGNLNKGRWITYLSMMILGLATKGPLTPQTASVLMKPFVEPFEATLIMNWVDGLGILQRLESDQSATVSEWWWLVVGRLALDMKGEGVARG
ncbi:hypothetical protein F4804DRAFT_266444 [Jackrogersella minutella]|nr:hypothetical protein F4804DRAFT_266444 [Jackrogersella minutella]